MARHKSGVQERVAIIGATAVVLSAVIGAMGLIVSTAIASAPHEAPTSLTRGDDYPATRKQGQQDAAQGKPQDRPQPAPEQPVVDRPRLVLPPAPPDVPPPPLPLERADNAERKEREKKAAFAEKARELERQRKRAAIKEFLSGEFAFATASIPEPTLLEDAAADPDHALWTPGAHWDAYKRRTAHPWYLDRARLIVMAGKESGSKLLYYYAGRDLNRKKYALGTEALGDFYERFAVLTELSGVFLGADDARPDTRR